MSEQNEQLLPCPFCDGPATLVEWTASPAEVKCEACGVCMDGFRDEAIAAWNRRAQPAPTVQSEPVGYIDPEILPKLAKLSSKGYVHTAISRHPRATLGFEYPLYAGAAPAHASSDGRDAKDAARWRETLRHVGGTYTDTGFQRFTLRFLSPVEGANIMRGGVAEHFTQAIDAALAGTGVKGGGS